jgi:hypothetical protein
MKNPISTSAPQLPVSQSVRQPIAKKIVVPKPDDFFAEMGLESKSTFVPPPSTIRTTGAKRLGATSLPMDDWGDDGDLDDLLDD